LNYLSEILAFYDWLAANPLPSSAIVLWHIDNLITDKKADRDILRYLEQADINLLFAE
jgi:hypothetical protein